MRLIYVDPSLRDLSGHNAEYARLVIKEARANGYDVTVYANKLGVKLFDTDQATNIIPWFSSGLKDEIVSKKARIRYFLSSLPGVGAVGKSALSALRKLKIIPLPTGDDGLERFAAINSQEYARIWQEISWAGDEILFLPNITWAELPQVISAAECLEIQARSIRVLLRFNPPTTVSAKERFAQVVKNAPDNFLFFCDTQNLADQYTAETGRVFWVAKIPIDTETVSSLRQTGEPNDIPRIGYFGEARVEKGFHYLPEVCDSFIDSDEANVQFLIQTTANQARVEKSVVSARERLYEMQQESLALFDHPLTPDDFLKTLAKVDILLMAYDSDAYRYRSSGLLVQAMALGKIVIIPGGENWLAQMVRNSSYQDRAVMLAKPADIHDALRAALQILKNQKPNTASKLVNLQSTLPAPWLL